ncbi:ATP-binding protein [Pedobacter riviphilus]|uniref:histidine kinase n=1 Tax=Pedobacter riviphilus TaxID=2766984 RepID=A0ABX6TD96_9SPHI|nr:EcoRII N-terminal effector-binding domain-containing protein [Pedobacter riviphilus]QNR83422.1 ATP-binding protein [Pedobacter riviphilus]
MESNQDMTDELSSAIAAVKAHQYSFCKFVSPNDAGATGAHQAGLYIPKNSIKLMFDEPGKKGENKEKFASIQWYDGATSECRFIYYGQGTRNEYRITRMGRSFKEGQLIILTKISEDSYLGFLLSDESEKNRFLAELELSEEDTNSLIMNNIISTGDYSFRPRARIIKVIGQELISNDVIALVELIKNSYDADARNIDIELNDIFSESGEIIVRDDGLGMTHEKIVDVWLEPATPDKKDSINKKFSICSKRRLLGEKGIGRFAAHRLGNNIELSSRAKLDCDLQPLDYETKVKIDWNVFTEDKYLEEIPITVSKVAPKEFLRSSGTIIKISNIHPWKNSKAVMDAVLKIKGLESPVAAKNTSHHEAGNYNDPGISINITSNDIKLNNEISDLKSFNELLETAFYKFKGIIDTNGNITYDYDFRRAGYKDIQRTVTAKEENLNEYDLEWSEEHPLNDRNTPGNFEVSFYAWDLDSASLKVAGLADYYKNIIKPNTGVRIYRDNFRVWPYGEPDNDWLELDLTRLNAPKQRTVSRNQIFGIVHISSIWNEMLADQSNREGLIRNENYEQFYHLVSSSLAIFAKERKTDKIKIDSVSTNNNSMDVVTQNIDKLRSEIEHNNHNGLYKQTVDVIEKKYHEKINDVLERYMMAAAIGISYSLPIHEMKIRLSSIKHVIEDIERNAVIEDKYLRELARQLRDTEDIVKAVSSIMSRQKRQKVNLTTVVSNVKILKEGDLEKYNINLIYHGEKEINVEALPGLLNTAVLNIVDNAVYWLRAKKIAMRNNNVDFQPQIIITSGINNENRPFLIIKDNGDGFKDPFELLTEPYYSRKTDGLGLGLYLVKEILTRIDASLHGYNDSGAVLEIIF